MKTQWDDELISNAVDLALEIDVNLFASSWEPNPDEDCGLRTALSLLIVDLASQLSRIEQSDNIWEQTDMMQLSKAVAEELYRAPHDFSWASVFKALKIKGIKT